MADTSSTTTTAPPETKQHKTRWLALLMLSLGLLMSVVDASVVNVTTPAMQKDFNASDAQMLMVVAAYTVMFASTLILFGKLAAKQGMRRYQIAGIGLFGLASLAIAMSSSITLVIILRAIEGLGAAMVGATGLALVNIIFNGTERSSAFGVWGAVAGLGAALGPLLGGIAVSDFTWRAAFLINVPIAIIVIIGAFLWITEVKRKGLASIDFLGAALVGLGLLAIIIGLIYGPTLGWWHPRTSLTFLGVSPVPWLLVVGILLLYPIYPDWVKRLGKKNEEPIFDLGLFGFSSFRDGMLAAMARQIAQFAPSYALAIYLQNAAGWPASTTGIVFVVAAVGSIVAGGVSGRLSNRYGTKPIIIAGIASMLLSIIWMWFVVGPTLTVGALVLPLLLYGVGIGLAASQLNTVVMTDVPKKQSGEASAAKSAVRQVGNSFATAFVGLLLAFSIGDVFVMAVLFAIVALVLSFKLPNIVGGGGEAAPGGE